jgi:hypothetical protein
LQQGSLANTHSTGADLYVVLLPPFDRGPFYACSVQNIFPDDFVSYSYAADIQRIGDTALNHCLAVFND